LFSARCITNDAVGGITRLLDMDVEPFLLSSVVKAFIAQRLVRTICPTVSKWRIIRTTTSPRSVFPVKELGTSFKRGAGCDQCRQTGYQRSRGRSMKFAPSPKPLRKLIMRKRDGGELKQCALSKA
jgi:general secretion pathway protein E/type IV pilus assembly protein PilB